MGLSWHHLKHNKEAVQNLDLLSPEALLLLNKEYNGTWRLKLFGT